MTQIVRLIVCAGLLVGSSGAFVLAEEISAAPPCAHELIYEPFAGLILVKVTIRGSPPMDFVLDSGATQSFITERSLASALGLEVREAGLARGMGSGATRVLIADDVSIRADGQELLRSPLVVHNFGVRLARMAQRDIHGFLGADLFERWVVEIDPATRRLLLHDSETWQHSAGGDILPLEVVDRRPVIEAEVVPEAGKKAVPVRLVVDTGSGRYLSLVNGSRRRLRTPGEGSLGGSVGVVGETLVMVAPVARLGIGTSVFENLETAWMESFQIPALRNIPKVNGILGNALLSRYHAIFDYRGGHLILR